MLIPWRAEHEAIFAPVGEHMSHARHDASSSTSVTSTPFWSCPSSRRVMFAVTFPVPFAVPFGLPARIEALG
eukprot:CAMPEP_0180125908 /NCGR_PEP_ID=MMETSP0986-20121125/5427_1 /TAXON_ID=697907 /ORGANISM="non described non described, Strain CCMP2293" /LENGTH=71 /DNA_ID=CAMNT_0022065329 /DNA_START=426 /DNA_END=637 /DNA_ORIENTATION=+